MSKKPHTIPSVVATAERLLQRSGSQPHSLAGGSKFIVYRYAEGGKNLPPFTEVLGDVEPSFKKVPQKGRQEFAALYQKFWEFQEPFFKKVLGKSPIRFPLSVATAATAAVVVVIVGVAVVATAGRVTAAATAIAVAAEEEQKDQRDDDQPYGGIVKQVTEAAHILDLLEF